MSGSWAEQEGLQEGLHLNRYLQSPRAEQTAVLIKGAQDWKLELPVVGPPCNSSPQEFSGIAI